MLDWDEMAFGSDERAKFLDPTLHHMALSALAAQALQAGKLEEAFILADRRCRISPTAEANDYLLKAEAARRLGRAAIAKQAIEQAIDIDPTAELVNLHALRLPDLKSRIRAAEAIIANPNSSAKAHRVALSHLEGSGRSIFGSTRILDNRVVGWLTWPQGRKLEGTIRYGSEGRSLHLLPDPHHPLATQERYAATLEEPCLEAEWVNLAFWCSDSPQDTYQTRIQNIEATRGNNWHSKVQSFEHDAALGYGSKKDPIDLAILIPVYEDFEATRRCLDNVEIQTSTKYRWRTIVINDASPNQLIVSDLRDRAGRGSIILIENEINIGFAASINKAAATIDEGALLLLNADAFLSAGCLDRLLTLANATPDVGTLTPLSNNGVVTSFPQSFNFNDLPDDYELSLLDSAALSADLEPVELPHGIGFCLLVTRWCWKAVGGLPLAYGQGYYEDIELCLRARDLGFRNLCATNVYVAHAGSRSFRASKRALVVENAKRLETRYPGYHAEYSAFQAANPFQSTFAKLERFIAPAPHDVLLVSPTLQLSAALHIWLMQELHLEVRYLTIRLRSDPSGASVILRSETEGLPQSIEFSAAGQNEQQALLNYIRQSKIKSVLLSDPANLSNFLIELVTSLEIPIQALASGAFMHPSSNNINASHESSNVPSTFPETAVEGSGLIFGDPKTHLQSLLDRCEKILCTDLMTMAYARHLLEPNYHAKCQTMPSLRTTVPSTEPILYVKHTCSAVIGILCPLPHPDVTHFIKAFSHLLSGAREGKPDYRIIVFGETLNDIPLMSNWKTFITGPLSYKDLQTIQYFSLCHAIVLPYRDQLYHVFDALSETNSIPRAYFNWSMGQFEAREGNLPLDPSLTWDEVASCVDQWLNAKAAPAC
jgi:GT2 family glycosyltransferase